VRRYNFKSLPVREGPNQLTVSCERHGPGKRARAAFKLDVRGVPEAFAECEDKKECLGRSGLGGDWSRPEAKDLRESVLLQWQCLHNEAPQKHTKVCTKWHGCLKKAERLERVLEILDAIVAKKADPLPQLAGVAKEVEALPQLAGKLKQDGDAQSVSGPSDVLADVEAACHIRPCVPECTETTEHKKFGNLRVPYNAVLCHPDQVCLEARAACVSQARMEQQHGLIGQLKSPLPAAESALTDGQARTSTPTRPMPSHKRAATRRRHRRRNPAATAAPGATKCDDLCRSDERAWAEKCSSTSNVCAGCPECHQSDEGGEVKAKADEGGEIKAKEDEGGEVKAKVGDQSEPPAKSCRSPFLSDPESWDCECHSIMVTKCDYIIPLVKCKRLGKSAAACKADVIEEKMNAAMRSCNCTLPKKQFETVAEAAVRAVQSGFHEDVKNFVGCYRALLCQNPAVCDSWKIKACNGAGLPPVVSSAGVDLGLDDALAGKLAAQLAWAPGDTPTPSHSPVTGGSPDGNVCLF